MKIFTTIARLILTADIVALAIQYGRYSYRRVAAMLRSAGWTVNLKPRDGLKVPARQPKRSRLWLNDGSCVRLRPEHPNHVWSYDFVETRTDDGRKVKMLNVIDEFTRECLAIRIARKLKGTDVTTSCPTSSSCAACRAMFGRTMAPSSSPKRSRPRSRPWSEDGLHRPRLSLGERLRRELQLQD